MYIKKSANILQKLDILTRGAKYDVSCASSGVQRQSSHGKIGNTLAGGLCHSWSSDGRCISLLKTLQTNYCANNCAYCINRCKNNIERTAVAPEELAKITYEFYRRNYIEGLFLSSGIFHNANTTMELMLDTVKILRKQYGFHGYIHIKILPGADDNAIEEAIFWADRVSINVELPTASSLKLLAPQKDLKQILTTMHKINLLRETLLSNPKQYGYYAKSGQSTQMIIGATPETDRHILRFSEYLYKKLQLKRVYYSAYVPLNQESFLPVFVNPPLRREHRLYQADWLLRFYKFSVDEILTENNPNLDERYDPKVCWALRHLQFFPVEVTKADMFQLLRVPGIGPISARRIISARRTGSINLETLKKLGVVLKRAIYFITIRGKYFADVKLDNPLLPEKLSDIQSGNKYELTGDLFSRELQPA